MIQPKRFQICFIQMVSNVLTSSGGISLYNLIQNPKNVILISVMPMNYLQKCYFNFSNADDLSVYVAVSAPPLPDTPLT